MRMSYEKITKQMSNNDKAAKGLIPDDGVKGYITCYSQHVIIVM